MNQQDTEVQKPLKCRVKGRGNENEAHVTLTVSSTSRSNESRIRRMTRATQILLAGYERLQKGGTA